MMEPLRPHSSLNPFAPSEHSEPKEAEGLGDVHLTSSPVVSLATIGSGERPFVNPSGRSVERM